MSREDHYWCPRRRWWADPCRVSPKPAPVPLPWSGPIPASTTTLPDSPDGTEKQIAWARKVRAKKWAGLLKASSKAGDDAPLRWLATVASAGWWIDHRDLSPARLFTAARAAIGPAGGAGPSIGR